MCIHNKREQDDKCTVSISPTIISQSGRPVSGHAMICAHVWQVYLFKKLQKNIIVGMTSDFFKLLTLLFLQVQCEELKETIQENFT